MIKKFWYTLPNLKTKSGMIALILTGIILGIIFIKFFEFCINKILGA